MCGSFFSSIRKQREVIKSHPDKGTDSDSVLPAVSLSELRSPPLSDQSKRLAQHGTENTHSPSLLYLVNLLLFESSGSQTTVIKNREGIKFSSK